MVASIRNISTRGVTIGVAPTPIFFKDLYNGTSTLSAHTPDIYVSGMYYNVDGSDLDGYVTGGFLESSNPVVGEYMFGSFGNPAQDPLSNTNSYTVSWNWYSGTSNGTYYNTYLIVRTHASSNVGFVLNSTGAPPGTATLTGLAGGGSFSGITIADDTLYSGTLTVTPTTISINFLGENHSWASANSGDTFNNQRPYGLYLLLSWPAKYADITLTNI